MLLLLCTAHWSVRSIRATTTVALFFLDPLKSADDYGHGEWMDRCRRVGDVVVRRGEKEL